MNQLEQLAQFTTIVADTGDLNAIGQYKPQDATTNPSLLLKAMELAEHHPLLDIAKAWAARQGGNSQALLSHTTDKLAVLIGQEILKVIPGRVSTEVDARLSFDTRATLAKAHRLIELYEQDGISRDRVLIKIASTWEGIRAAEQLERDGIHCNLTLLFSFAQAQTCADAGVFLISPFVGRIHDWYKAKTGARGYAPADDPGVQSVQRIYAYYKTHGYATVVMGASFRNTGQVLQLAGCDRLTIAPTLMETLFATKENVSRILNPVEIVSDDARQTLDEVAFRWANNEDAMATEKLAEGIRLFAADQLKLEQIVAP